MTKDLQVQNRKLLEAIKKSLPDRKPVLIIPHDYPDPDALASAAGMELLVREALGLRGRIIFTGMVNRAENQQLLKHFKVGWKLANKMTPPKNSLPAIILDTKPWAKNITLPAFAKPKIILDHHPYKKSLKREAGILVDNQKELGATVTRVFELLQAAEVAIPKWLSTVMLYAIATETLDLSQDTSERDLEAYRCLLGNANFGVLGKIRHAPLPRSYYSQIQEAIGAARTYGRVSWSHLNQVGHPEIIAEIADLLLRMERTSWAFCTGYAGDRLLISIRSSQKGARCGRLMKNLVAGKGSGGGHPRMAAGYIDLAGESKGDWEGRRESLDRAILSKIEPRGPFQEPGQDSSQALVSS